MGFEDVMMKRLADCHAEACKEILTSVRAGRSLGDAVADAIEAFPPSKTRDLRRWLEDWEAWHEWKNWEAAGWQIVKKGSEIFVVAPHRYPNDGPSKEEIMAGAGVRMMRYVGDSGGHGFPTREVTDHLSNLDSSRRSVVLVTQYHTVRAK